jgi:DNA-binding beta-propeller fold protein YncE
MGGGAVLVTVTDSSGDPVEGATVTSAPVTHDEQTDDLGQVLLTDLDPGFYRIRAEDSDGLAAAEAVRVDADEIADVTIELPSASEGGWGSPSSSDSLDAGSFGSVPITPRDAGSARDAGRDAGPSDTGISDPFINVATQVEAMLLDPKRPWLYALDQVNNALLFINTDERAVKKTVFVGSKPSDLDISLDGSELYVANWGSTEISVIDLVKQDIGRKIFVDTSLGTWQGNPYRIATLADNLLVFTTEDQWCDLKLVRGSDGVNITTTASVYEPDLVAAPDGKTLFVAESGSTGSGLHRYSVSSTGLTAIDSSGTASGYGSRKAVVTGDGQYVFYAGNKFLASNLKNILGQFGEAIYAANQDGTLAVGQSKIYNGTTFAILRPLPLTTTVSALSSDAKTLYLYDVKSSRIYIEDLSGL